MAVSTWWQSVLEAVKSDVKLHIEADFIAFPELFLLGAGVGAFVSCCPRCIVKLFQYLLVGWGMIGFCFGLGFGMACLCFF